MTETTKKPVRKYKIVNVERETERFVVTADFMEVMDGKDKVVGSVNHGFPLTMKEDEVEKEISKACKVFFLDKDSAIANKARDKRDKEAEVTKSKLTNKEHTI